MKMQGPRAGALRGEITEKQYDIIDAVAKIAAECGRQRFDGSRLHG